MRRCLLLVLVGCRPPAPVTLEPPPPATIDLAAVRIVEPPPSAEPLLVLAQRTQLDEVAAVAARSAGEDHVVSARALREAMAARLGSGMWPHVLTGWGSDAEITEQLEAGLAELRAAVDIAELGMATAHGPAGRVGVIVALPLPRLPIEVTRGGDTARLAMPWVWPDAPAAYAVTATASRRLEPEVFEHARFELALDCTRPAAIEIRAGSRIVASVVDACGEPAPDDTLGALDLGPPAHTRIEIERRVFELVNRERVAHGQAPLAWDDDAHRFARSHAADMARYAYVGHVAPDGSSFQQRVAHSAIRPSASRENVGHAWGPGEAHRAFMTSAGHRANLLAGDVARGAVGIEVDRSDPRAFYVTQFFLTP